MITAGATRRFAVARTTRAALAAGAQRPAAPMHLPASLVAGAGVLALVTLVAVAAPLLSPYAPDQIMAGARLAAPSWAHPFGTDNLGRDLFSRVLWGARAALGGMAYGVAISAVLGVAPGLWSGYSGGWRDQLLSRLMDTAQAFPGLLLALVVVARLGPSFENAVLALGIVGAPSFYRLARGLALSARQAAYVEAARAAGAGEARILLRHILPNMAYSLIVLATLRAGYVLLAIGGLSFIGLGAQPPSPEWGTLLAAGRTQMAAAPWLAIFPGLALALTVAAVNMLGDGLNEWRERRQAR